MGNEKNTTVAGITLTDSQQNALNAIKAFIGQEDRRAFILKGYAGTGKTTLVKAITMEVAKNKLQYILLASTGRAAKVLSDSVRSIQDDGSCFSSSASTIHSLIYTFDDINQDLDLFSNQIEVQNLATDKGIKLLFHLRKKVDDGKTTIYIVDESSMISDEKDTSMSQAQYGAEGRLLKDLLSYDKNGKFIFIGDACQLPPVNSPYSPALNASYFQQTFQIEAYETALTEIVRQADDNDIPLSSAKIRKLYFNPPQDRIAKFPFKGYRHIHILHNEYELLSRYINDIREHDYSKATMIVMSNKNVTQLSSLIRPAIGMNSNSICEGDLLLVTQNNLVSGLMNGDLVRVIQIGMRENRAGLSFIHVQVESLASGHHFSQLLLEDILYSGKTNLSQEQQTHLMIDFHIRMREAGIKQKSDAYVDHMRNDSYLNALRCVYGYALTCHKSQGGEWDKVYLVIPRNLPYLTPRSYVYQWVYTAMTRAKKDLYIIDDYWVQ